MGSRRWPIRCRRCPRHRRVRRGPPARRWMRRRRPGRSPGTRPGRRVTPPRSRTTRPGRCPRTRMTCRLKTCRTWPSRSLSCRPGRRRSRPPGRWPIRPARGRRTRPTSARQRPRCSGRPSTAPGLLRPTARRQMGRCPGMPARTVRKGCRRCALPRRRTPCGGRSWSRRRQVRWTNSSRPSGRLRRRGPASGTPWPSHHPRRRPQRGARWPRRCPAARPRCPRPLSSPCHPAAPPGPQARPGPTSRPATSEITVSPTAASPTPAARIS
jgi:hypothetical protein